jgi:hypothetical protein
MAAVFKDLCIDAVDIDRQQRFWAGILGLHSESRGDSRLMTGERPEHTVWINAVPEPPTVKNRVHLDVFTESIDALVERGAGVQQPMDGWTIMTDPEDNEFCGFVRDQDQLPSYRLYELGVDATDPKAIATWWALRFGVAAQNDGGPDLWLIAGGSLPWEVFFQRVPEPKTIKNRVHWDVLGDTQEFLDAGATLLRSADNDISWDVLADPEGNEFCVFRPSS